MLVGMRTQDLTPSSEGAPVRGEPIAIELMNTLWADREGVHDALTTARGATQWLAELKGRLPRVQSLRGPARRALSSSETAHLRRLRDAMRLVAAEVTADPRPIAKSLGHEGRSLDDALSVINGAAQSLPVRLLHRINTRITADRRGVSPLSASTGSFAVDAIALLAGDHDSGLLRACLAPGCVLYFVQDHALREWCSPACGNRARVARHYERTQVAKRGKTKRQPT